MASNETGTDSTHLAGLYTRRFNLPIPMVERLPTKFGRDGISWQQKVRTALETGEIPKGWENPLITSRVGLGLNPPGSEEALRKNRAPTS